MNMCTVLTGLAHFQAPRLCSFTPTFIEAQHYQYDLCTDVPEDVCQQCTCGSVIPDQGDLDLKVLHEQHAQSWFYINEARPANATQVLQKSYALHECKRLNIITVHEKVLMYNPQRRCSLTEAGNSNCMQDSKSAQGSGKASIYGWKQCFKLLGVGEAVGV